ncbi:hypothetical protein [Klugiella xanthotipulae]|uniref:hypothetical protein n=1 Tax=Klugiella xanthotipulae TaxID=244735 RepID=UPI0011540F0A|nr:hypothetical protein [Klugiella xanthotipulae]
MSLAFDVDVADALVRAVSDAAVELRGQGVPRRLAVECAAEGFSGAYAKLFTTACVVESEDRVRLARVLEGLAEDVGVAKLKAQEELARQEEVAAWEAREAAREAARLSAPGPLSSSPWMPVPLYDPEPFDVAVAPPSLSVMFRPRERVRAGGGSGAMSSAVPASLRVFVGQSRGSNGVLDTHLTRVRGAWAGFTGSCSWVPIDSVTFLSGFQFLVSENEEDVAWIDQVADAFERAGGGRLSDVVLARASVVRAVPVGDAELLEIFGSLSGEDLGVLLAGSPELLLRLQGIDPVKISEWWAGLNPVGVGEEYSRQQDALLEGFPDVFGALDGVPALARVRANRVNSTVLLKAVEIELRGVESGELAGGGDRADFLREEIAYLKQVESGQVQLYLYDRGQSRIVEMIGTPGPDTQRVVTYVPGTFTGLGSFYTGGVQQISKYLADNLPGTVAFVYKDGLFPGEGDTSASPNMLRVTEANDPETARAAGEQLARFGRGMRTDPRLSAVHQIGIGHSWGVANLTSSEVAGTEYRTVISLSGAGMLPEWQPRPKTGYVDLSYWDILQSAQQQGYVWKGNNPRRHPGFVSFPYYEGSDDEVLEDNSIPGVVDRLKVLMDNHNLIATDSKDNREVLEDLVELTKA